MSIEWRMGDENNDWQEYVLVSMQFSMRHILFIMFYICVLFFVGVQRYNDGVKYGRDDERESYSLMSKAENSWWQRCTEEIIKKEKDLKDKEASYLEIIKKQRKAFVELEHRFFAEQQLDILELKLDSD